MNDEFPSTAKEINRAKVSLFRTQSEFILSRESVTETERQWLNWATGRISTLEMES